MQRVWNKDVPLSEVPDEHYQTVKQLLAEAKKAQARLDRILGRES